jgi:ABC-type transporter Mla subunit MlaD
MRVLCLPALFCASLFGQAASSGVSSDWDVREMLSSLQARAKQLGPILDQLKPADWVRDGAPAQYTGQWNTAKSELGYLLASAQTLAKDPDKLPAALDTLFRMQALNSTLGSVIEGTRKYQNPAIADLVQAIADENDHNRDRLRQYVMDLAAEKEHELQVMDAEAQRCRTTVSNQKPQGKR